MTRRAIVTWMLMIPVAFVNGIVREGLIQPAVGERRAHQISVVTGSSAFFTLVYAMLHREVASRSDRQLATLGAAWVSATVLFEFGFGHYVMGSPWSRLMQDYNLAAGRLWSLVLLVIGISPLAVRRVVTTRGTVHDRRDGCFDR
jgi:hypothetical protein